MSKKYSKYIKKYIITFNGNFQSTWELIKFTREIFLGVKFALKRFLPNFRDFLPFFRDYSFSYDSTQKISEIRIEFH